MAIVHVAFKSSSLAPPAAAHAQYLAREGQYEQRGGLEMLESGNMPRFAEADPQAFWVAADAHERANGRTYTEVQVALPRELNPEQRQELARETARELLGERFAYTMAVHTPLAKDNIDQPHMHLMFSERIIDERTRLMPEEQFFKRNGAKKDREAWHGREKPEEVRAKWVEMMNGAMRKAGFDQQLDPRSWAEQGRADLAELREEKTLQGNGREARERNEDIDILRAQRATLPAPGLDREAAIAVVEKLGERQVAVVQEREQQELSRLDKLIATMRELAGEVKERTVASAQYVADRMKQFRERMAEMREARDGKSPSPVQEQQPQRAGPQLEPGMDIGQKRQAFREWYTAEQKAREPVVPEQKVEPPPPEQKQEQEKKPEREISRGFGLGM